MAVTGPAANIPSVSNNRQMYLPTKLLDQALCTAVKYPRTAWHQAKIALGLSRKLRPHVMMNEDHRARLKALTVLYEQEVGHPKPRLPASKEQPWSFMCFISNLSNRTDSHNIPKALCDWMEDVGLIENDLYIDVGCWRKKNLDSERVDSLEVFGCPFHISKEAICQMRNKTLSLMVNMGNPKSLKSVS